MPDDLTLLSDGQLQAHIGHCGRQMLAANALGMVDERRRWLALQEAALRERHRRPEVVASLETERGLT